MAVDPLVLLGILNWVGISESARVSMVGACIAFVSDLAILVTVFTHLSFQQFLSLFPEMFSGRAITPTSILIGYAGSFLAFSGLESISQLAPNMKLPRRVVGKIALFLVVLTVGLTSPLLTMLSTLLLPNDAANAERSAQIISLLAGHWGGPILQTEVAISAGALLIFASNTAIIGSYHVFLALSRMEFFSEALLQRNKLRDTPHYAIILATGIPMVVLLLVHGNINILGDMYAFGLLGAFTLTCLGMDIVRYRQNKVYHLKKLLEKQSTIVGVDGQSQAKLEGHQGDQLEVSVDGQVESRHAVEEQAGPAEVPESPSRWASSPVNFWLGILTTLLVMIAWCTNLIAKPLATAFGGSVAVVGMLIAFASYLYHRRRGRVSVVATGVTKHVPGTVLAILSSNDPNNEKVIQVAINNKEHRPVVFLYLGQGETERREIFRMTEPHINDVEAKDILGRANHLALEKHIECYFLYRQYAPDTVQSVWRTLHPGEIILEQRQRNLLGNLSLVSESEEDDVLRLRKAHHVTAL
ncbi:hypothetical protein KSD_06380 [Ktedonobacter sp. SOSP1-85]|uniref:APC family permease n=1 Tax=Ktedonobacter sp. SOSP1-85 TaxID=2778367 RepID=UPI00191509B4|nr:APC family permease [Ktedonobacter sp. SOSP1-85]GHO72867.1 hypothetical protein KSD_06380 [Ktedonobacter sp. SOSP1-85]